MSSAPDTPTVLAGILRSTRAELERRMSARSLQELMLDTQAARPGGLPEPRLRTVLARPGIGVIAEFKRASPSAGPFAAGADPREVAAAYRRGGALAMSVLTEEPNFMGSLEDLRAARAASDLPILRKDFTVDPYQLYEAAAAGADAVLLIVAALDRATLTGLHGLAGRLGLDALVEVHDEFELAVAAEIGADLIGVNNRDLRDLTVDLHRTSRLLPLMPAGAVVVSESGIGSREQLERLEREGVHGVLVGESLMRSGNPEAALRDLIGTAAETVANF